MSPLDLVPLPKWRDVIDILFLAFVAYQLYVWFRGTRALRVLIGLVVLGGVYSLAKLWGLFLTTWVFQILWQVLVILLLILFQSEIRQVLEKVSPLRFLRSKRRFTRGVLSEELADAVFDLAREGTGALIVLERDDNPAEFLSAGQTIMSLPEPVLIKAIFNHHSPSHDGAVILSQGRLTQMGCILPLSDRENLPDQYGTRHRAALGLSERTDAVCIVVSEERGEVSTVVGGKITNHENPKALASKINDLLNIPDIPSFTLRDFVKGTFVKNWGPKLGALLLVTLAWLVLASQQEIETNAIAQIQYRDLSTEQELDKGSTQAVRLTLSGKRHIIKGLKDQKISVQVGLEKLSAGTHSIKLSAKNIDLPLGIVVKQVIPQDITVVLRPRAVAPEARRTQKRLLPYP